MQRIISLQTSRNADRASTEFVSKRLCCSFLFSVAFLSLLGGFLLGRYATDRALYLKSTTLHHMQQTEENHSIDVINNITSHVHHINDMTQHVKFKPGNFDFKEFYVRLTCANFTPEITDLNIETHFSLKSNKILTNHLEAINRCFSNIAQYLDVFVHKNVTTD